MKKTKIALLVILIFAVCVVVIISTQNPDAEAGMKARSAVEAIREGAKIAWR